MLILHWIAISIFLVSPQFRVTQGNNPTPENAEAFWMRVAAGIRQNDLKKNNYTFLEDFASVNYDDKGEVKTRDTAKYETIFVEGLPYRRQIEANGKALSGKAAEKEEKRYEETVAERRKMSLEQKRGHFFNQHFQVGTPIADLGSLFSPSIDGEETENGHTLVKMTMTPKADAKPKTEQEKDAMHTTIHLWVDKTDSFPVHVQRTYVSDGAHVDKGSSMDLSWQKMADGTYVPAHFLLKYTAKMLLSKVPGETEQTFHDYKKFSVDIRILPQVDEVPTEKRQ
ncbi:MAG TPA: hypothetical protein VKZ53_03340 [Candidatus Angelobacter sp.]|nr:hypothetical protein [Candidatus Angelobacter sp.]